MALGRKQGTDQKPQGNGFPQGKCSSQSHGSHTGIWVGFEVSYFVIVPVWLLRSKSSSQEFKKMKRVGVLIVNKGKLCLRFLGSV